MLNIGYQPLSNPMIFIIISILLFICLRNFIHPQCLFLENRSQVWNMLNSLKRKKNWKKMLKMNFAKDSFFFFLGVKNYSQPIKLFLYSSEFTYFVCHFTNFLKDLKALRRWITHDNL